MSCGRRVRSRLLLIGRVADPVLDVGVSVVDCPGASVVGLILRAVLGLVYGSCTCAVAVLVEGAWS